MIAARLDGLPPDEKRLLQCASVSGDGAGTGLLGRLAPGLDVPGVAAQHGVAGPPAPRRGIAGTGRERVHLQARVQSETSRTGSLPKGERAHLHREVADWLSHDAEDGACEPLDDLARNYAEAWAAVTYEDLDDGSGGAGSIRRDLPRAVG